MGEAGPRETTYSIIPFLWHPRKGRTVVIERRSIVSGA